MCASHALSFTGDTHLILIFDGEEGLDHGALLASLEGIDCMSDGVSRRAEGGAMHWFRAAAVPAGIPALAGLNWSLIKPLLPVENCSARKPQLLTRPTGSAAASATTVIAPAAAASVPRLRRADTWKHSISAEGKNSACWPGYR